MSASPLSINFHSPRNPSYLSVYNGLRIICSSPGNFTSQGLDLMSNLDLGEMMGLPPLYSSNVYVQCIRPMYTSNAHVQFRILQLANWIAYRVVRVRVNSRILSSSPDVFPDFKVLYFAVKTFDLITSDPLFLAWWNYPSPGTIQRQLHLLSIVKAVSALSSLCNRTKLLAKCIAKWQFCLLPPPSLCVFR